MSATLSRIPLIMALTGLLFTAACDDSPTAPAQPVPTEITLNFEEITFGEIGETVTLEAIVLDEDGEVIPNAQVTWSSSDEEVATVDEEGVVEAVGEGPATITATSGEATATAEVLVEVDEG